jgi:hypothetical protein
VRRVGRTIAFTSLLAAVMTLGPGGTAFADPLAGGDDSYKYVRVSSSEGDSGGGGGGGSSCSWKKYDREIDHSMASPYMHDSYNIQRRPDGTVPDGTFYWVTCSGETDFEYVLDGEPYHDPLTLAQQAYKAIRGQQPTVNVNPQRALVKLPTWFWVDGNVPDVTATAETFNQSATVTAKAERVLWDIGDTELACDYPSAAYDPDVHEPTDHSPTPCEKLFAQAQEGLEVTAQIEYSVTWTSEGVLSDGGTLDPLLGPESPAVVLNVNEVQTINR